MAAVMEAIGTAARAIASGEYHFVIAGGVESMSRAPFVMGKADSAFSRSAEIHDTTMGWRFINPLMALSRILSLMAISSPTFT